MPSPNTDRNLLFGILAVQMDFITKDALIQAMHAWVLDKAKPVGRILLDQGALAADTYALLQALVQKHLALHENDPDKSLAALSTLGSVRDALRTLGHADPDLAASLAHVASARLNDDSLATRTFAAGEQTSAGLRFRILRPHAKGGLGEVFVAEDAELHREVALKEIQGRYADDPQNRARFLLEAEITGGLEHPGIIPVYGLGQYDDGRPFYAMRFIKGDNLKDAIERFHKAESPNRDASERALDLRKLLRRFQDVCNAVAYAHSRGVLHRDLKPGNIMLGQFGETLVVDWGLAKTLDESDPEKTKADCPIRPTHGSGSEPTQMGTAIGSPQYMSPEQAAGQHDLLGPRSDVYGLGATLYCLLTGKPPVQGANVAEILRKVRNGDFPSARQFKKDVPEPLDAICKKALSLHPESRYSSPEEMAADLEAWLADEPVRAWQEPWSVRSGRWIRRHRTLVTSGVAVLAIATLALAGGVLYSSQAKDRERALRQIAENKEQEAQEQETKAKANFLLARESVNRYLKRVSENRRLKDAGLAKLRKELLDEAGEFYQQFIRERTDDPTLEAELSQAYLQAAKIETETGAAARALVRYQEAREYIKKLAAAHPDDLTLQTDWAFCTVNLGLLSRSIDRNDDAGRYYQEALEKLEPLVATNPDNSNLLNRLAGTYKSLASLYRAQSNYPAAIKTIENARALFEKLSVAHPDNGAYADSLAGSWSNLGLMQRDQGNHQGAVASLRAALGVQKKLVERLPDEDDYRIFLASIYLNLALACESGDQFEEAEKAFTEALPLYRKVSDRHPEIGAYRQAQAMGLTEMGRFYGDINKPDQSLASLNEALAIWRQLAARDPDISINNRELARCLANVGNFYFGQGRHAEALPPHQEALALREKLAAANPEVALYQRDLHNSQDDVGLVLGALSRFKEAEAAFQAAVNTSEKLAAKHPKIPDYVSNTASGLHHLGTLYLNMDDLTRAEMAYRNALAAREKLVGMAANTPYFEYGLAKTQRSLGNLLSERRQYPEAEGFLAAALAKLENLAAKNPEVTDYVGGLGDACAARGDHEQRQNRNEPALQWYGKAIDTLLALRVKSPKAERARGYLVNASSGRAVSLTRLNRLPESLKDWEQALNLAKDDEKPGLRLGQAMTVAQQGDHAQATSSAEESIKDSKTSGKLFMKAAAVFAMAGPGALRDVRLPAADQTALAERYAIRAIELLNHARDLGYFKKAKNRACLNEEAEWKELQKRDDFKRFCAEVAEK